MAMTAAAGALSNSLSSATNLLSPHQQAQHQIHQLSPKEREALIESRLGSMSSITSTRTIEQKIPRVDIPDDMEGAFGFDPDGGLGYDKLLILGCLLRMVWHTKPSCNTTTHFGCCTTPSTCWSTSMTKRILSWKVEFFQSTMLLNQPLLSINMRIVLC